MPVGIRWSLLGLTSRAVIDLFPLKVIVSLNNSFFPFTLSKDMCRSKALID